MQKVADCVDLKYGDGDDGDAEEGDPDHIQIRGFKLINADSIQECFVSFYTILIMVLMNSAQVHIIN